jgi:hypothetical protein
MTDNEKQEQPYDLKIKKNKIYLVFFALILVAVLISFFYKDLKNFFRKEPVSRQSEVIVGDYNPIPGFAKNSFSPVIEKAEISSRNLPVEVESLILSEVVLDDIQKVNYQDGRQGFILNGSANFGVRELYFKFMQSKFIFKKGWELTVGARNENNALIEYKHPNWLATILIKSKNAQADITNFEIKVIENK